MIGTPSRDTIASPRRVTRPLGTRRRSVWLDAREMSSRGDAIVLAAQNTSIETFLIAAAQLREFEGLSARLRLVIEAGGDDRLEEIDLRHVIASSNPDVLWRASHLGHCTALLATIRDRDSLERTIDRAPQFQYVVVSLVDPTNIPLELVIARLRATETEILKEVSSSEAALVAFATLESGTDGVLLQTTDAKELLQLERECNRLASGRIELVTATVTRTQYIGMGHRACVDTVSLMTEDDGFLVGSTSAGGLLACAEVHPLPYMELRPFRVNAGAIHSYVWAPDNLLAYLSELRVGRRVLCVRTDGTARALVVGRIKIEVRPLLLVEATHGGVVLNVVVQDDWHIRLFAPDGGPVSVTSLKPGQPLLAHVTEPGRHVGLFVKESIVER